MMTTVYSPAHSGRPHQLKRNDPLPDPAVPSVSSSEPAQIQSFQSTRPAPSSQSIRDLRSRTTEAGDTVAPQVTATMSMETMIGILKERKLAIHGAHVYLLGMPAILSLASAYATDKITRKVFLETLDLFVRHARRAYATHPKAVKSHHLVSLGIPEADIGRFPMVGSGLDIWTVAGLFNGVIDVEDMILLHDSEKKGLFQQRHFPGTRTVPAPNPISSYRNPWNGQSLVLAFNEWSLAHFDEVIPPACAILEAKPSYWDPVTHYMLRLRAAHLKGEPLSVFRFDDTKHMESVFQDIFHVVDPDYQPGVNARQEWENFHFVEPKITETGDAKQQNKAGASASSRRSCWIPCDLI